VYGEEDEDEKKESAGGGAREEERWLGWVSMYSCFPENAELFARTAFAESARNKIRHEIAAKPYLFLLAISSNPDLCILL
jgi:hypothetical protein